jgi:curved DNA-binding protein CbpA
VLHGFSTAKASCEQNKPIKTSFPATRSPHAILQVSSNATPEVIRAAYRALALKHHPDKGGNQESFQEIQKAYDTLTKQ